MSHFSDAFILVDCGTQTLSWRTNIPLETCHTLLFHKLKKVLGSKVGRIISLKGKLTKIAGKNDFGFDNTFFGASIFNFPFFLEYNRKHQRLYLSEQDNYIIRSVKDSSANIENRKLEIEVGQPEKKGYSNGMSGNSCKLKDPRGFDWDMDDNMYICNLTCICKVDGKSNQVSLVAGHETDNTYKDGNNDEARFYQLSALSCYQRYHHQRYPLLLYVCDSGSHCIRKIDITNGKTSTFAGKGKEEGDMDGTLQSARFDLPWDIVKDNENDDILYVSDSGNEKIKMIDMKKGIVETLADNCSGHGLLNLPHQLQIVDNFIYAACFGNKNCIVRIEKHTKQVSMVQFGDGEIAFDMFGIAYHEHDQCFYISDEFNIYKLE